MLTALHEECPGLLSIEAGQEGLFVCARLPRGVDDVAIVAKARERGIVLAALSPRYDRPTDDRGLLFGFSGHSPDKLREGVKTLARDSQDDGSRALVERRCRLIDAEPCQFPQG